ncbi:uncharacterized protein LOC130795995 isoform X2 [Actinidia eriantha]|uniref:uncharacterized protein LOC130795995 isoform X2 n=1 Tax=Actinidia eriantha TaxID=165200 RepID=UPI002584B4D6|nr:uncharacterized protein LOC130795995 isoform X2 [Actinidia eriantha]
MVVASGTNSFAKEIAIRKRIASIFNKRDDDFPSLREYNDYLEEVEDMTCNLIEGIDVPSIEAKIAEYQKENSEQIMNAQARKAEEYAAALASSKGQPVQADIDAVRSIPQALKEASVLVCRGITHLRLQGVQSRSHGQWAWAHSPFRSDIIQTRKLMISMTKK